MDTIRILMRLKDWGPVLFALGFLAPLIAQTVDRAGFVDPTGSAHVPLGLAIALPLGLVAKLRGRWV